MAEPRRVTFTLSDMRDLTSLELARAMATAGAPLSRYEELVRLTSRGTAADAPADDIELALTLTYAMAWQFLRRSEPGVTWAEAQTWRVLMDYGETEAEADAMAEAEAEMSIRAAMTSGLPPAEAGKLTIRELDAYSRARDRMAG